MLPLVEFILQTILLQFVHILQLLHLFFFQSLNLHPHFLSHLYVLPKRQVLVVQNVHIRHSFGLEVTLQLSAPLSKEVVASPQKFIGLLLGLQLTTSNLLLKLMCCFIISQLAFQLVEIAF